MTVFQYGVGNRTLTKPHIWFPTPTTIYFFWADGGRWKTEIWRDSPWVLKHVIFVEEKNCPPKYAESKIPLGEAWISVGRSGCWNKSQWSLGVAPNGSFPLGVNWHVSLEDPFETPFHTEMLHVGSIHLHLYHKFMIHVYVNIAVPRSIWDFQTSARIINFSIYFIRLSFRTCDLKQQNSKTEAISQSPPFFGCLGFCYLRPFSSIWGESKDVDFWKEISAVEKKQHQLRWQLIEKSYELTMSKIHPNKVIHS